MSERPQLNDREMLLALWHAVFGVNAEGGMVAAIEGLRVEFHELRQEIGKLYKIALAATLALIGTIVGGMVTVIVILASGGSL